MKRKVVIISDLHLGANPPMMSQTARLAAFIDSLASAEDEHLYLVIAGDFIDFLSIEYEGKLSSFSGSPKDIEARIQIALQREKLVCEALGRFLRRPKCTLVVLVGNHDVEMALPSAQARFAEAIGAGDGYQPVFIDDGRAWNCGRLLVEHGNRYDFANANDWDGIRQFRSAHSRGELPPRELEISAGSEFVATVLSPLKKAYPFLDLLQPQGVLIGYLLVALEPAQLSQISSLWTALRANYQAARNRDGYRPAKAGKVAAGPGPAMDVFHSPLVFEDIARKFEVPPPVFIGPYKPWSKLDFFARAPGSNGIAELIRKEKPIPSDQLARLGVVLRQFLKDDELKAGDDFVPYRLAAQGMTAKEELFDTVIMGHTHHPERFSSNGSDVAYYLNSGSWIDTIPLTSATLNSAPEFEAWLRKLVSGDSRLRTRRLTYVTAGIAEDGSVRYTQLNEWTA